MSEPVTSEDGANVEPTILTISAESLAEAGLESQVRSWIGDGPNEAITADQIVAVVGEDQLAQAAEVLGREPGDLAADLAARLPELVEATAPDGGAASEAQGALRSFGLTLTDDVRIDGSATSEMKYL
ncbi:YidB family protein [Embleya sp. NPDC059237]|uniref:YidB family protein n=1 Tax=Embleya sp. NPDC059237 TaxID=3346784 RepID=UPI0036C0D291